jgi:Type II secretion system (T2SS), protein G
MSTVPVHLVDQRSKEPVEAILHLKLTASRLVEVEAVGGNTVMKPSVCAVAAVFISIVCPSLAAADSNIGRAKMDIKNLEKAIQVYKAKHGSYPVSLAVMTEADGDEAAWLKDEALYDPWKRPYHYERDRLDPISGIPQIWSEGPDPADSSRKIANWPQPPQAPFWQRVINSIHAPVFFLALLVFTPLVFVLIFATPKRWKLGEGRGWVLLLVLALGWLAYLALLGLATSALVLENYGLVQPKPIIHAPACHWAK